MTETAMSDSPEKSGARSAAAPLPPPNTMEHFAALAERLPRPYNNQQLEQAWRALEQAAVTTDNVGLMCQGLGQLRMPQSGELLARKWATIPEDARGHVLSWGWQGKEKQQVVSNAMSAASKIAGGDVASAVHFVRIAVEHADNENARRTAVILLREDWLQPPAVGEPRLFEMIPWTAETAPWRRRLAALLADAALNKYAAPKDKRVGPVVQQAVADWLRKAADEARDDEERSSLQQCIAKLAPQGQSAPAVDKPLQPPSALPSPTAPAPVADAPSRPSEAGKSYPGRAESTPREHPGRAGGRFKRLLEALGQVQRAVEELDGREPAGGPEVDRLRADVAVLKRSEDALQMKLDELRAELKRRGVAAEDARAELAETRQSLTAAEERVAALTAELEQVRQQSEQERQQNRQHTQVERDAAVRGLTERLAEQLRHDVRNLKGAEQKPASPEQAKFVIGVAKDMLQRLKANGIQVE